MSKQTRPTHACTECEWYICVGLIIITIQILDHADNNNYPHTGYYILIKHDIDKQLHQQGIVRLSHITLITAIARASTWRHANSIMSVANPGGGAQGAGAPPPFTHESLIQQI